MIKRWFAYIQLFDYVLVHVDTNSNALADCISRCVHIPPRPVHAAPRLLQAARHVPAPSLLDCGDVESNPGPPSDDEIVCISDSSSSSGNTPLVAPISPAAPPARRSADAPKRPDTRPSPPEASSATDSPLPPRGRAITRSLAAARPAAASPPVPAPLCCLRSRDATTSPQQPTLTPGCDSHPSRHRLRAPPSRSSEVRWYSSPTQRSPYRPRRR
jgi:hypothetical protein